MNTNNIRNLYKDRVRYTELFWLQFDWWADEILELEAYWGARGKLEELRKARNRIWSVFDRFRFNRKKYKMKRKKVSDTLKHYNHLWHSIDRDSWKTPSDILEQREDDWVAENQEYFLQM